MPDQFGALAVPVPAPAGPADGVGDPGLSVIVDFVKAVLNANAGAAWAKLVPREPVLVNQAQVFDPLDGLAFNEADLPAIYAYRNVGAEQWVADDHFYTVDDLVLYWVYPTANDEERRQMVAFQNVIRKVIVRALHLERDPAWVLAGDADPQSATLPALPTAIKLSVATNVAPQVYSGGALDGSVGQGFISPRRPVTITGAGNPAAFTPDAVVTVVGLNVLGVSTTWALSLPHVVAVPFVLTTPNDCSQVTSVSFPAMVSAAGTWTVGLGAFAGVGSMVLDAAGLMSATVKRLQPKKLTIQMSEPEDRRVYDMVEIVLGVEERLDLDESGFPASPQVSLSVTLQTPGSTFVDDARFPDGDSADTFVPTSLPSAES